MDTLGNTLVIGLSNRCFQVYDMRNMQSPIEERMSPLKYMTRRIACMSNGQGFAISSIEGRIALEYFDAIHRDKKYAFKCHRAKSIPSQTSTQEEESVYSVDALAFHPK